MSNAVVLRLTLFYLGIIMAMSIAFSIVIYNISSEELRRGSMSSGKFITMIEDPFRAKFEADRQLQIDDSRHKLQSNLVMLNIGALAFGAVISYGLARRTLQPIEEAFESQGRFTADASHELRTPLTAMQTSIEVGLRNPKLTLAGSKDLLHSMLDEVKKLSSLSNGLLKLTRNNGQDMPLRPVNLADIAQDAVAQLELTAKRTNIRLNDAVGQVVVKGDEVSIKEALVILLDNAIKYSPSDTTITITSRQQGRFGSISVTDQGHGIKAIDMEHIFDRFYRADSARSRNHVEGYGLGLSIAQKIAEAHGGSLEAKSRPGEGSTFTLKLPLSTDAEA
jgi:signal transduction histidine kinase